MVNISDLLKIYSMIETIVTSTVTISDINNNKNNHIEQNVCIILKKMDRIKIHVHTCEITHDEIAPTLSRKVFFFLRLSRIVMRKAQRKKRL